MGKIADDKRNNENVQYCEKVLDHLSFLCIFLQRSLLYFFNN